MNILLKKRQKVVINLKKSLILTNLEFTTYVKHPHFLETVLNILLKDQQKVVITGMISLTLRRNF